VKKIIILYHSQQVGNTRKMAELVARDCREVEGVEVELLNLNERRASLEAVESADGLALGTPDYFGYMAGGLKQFFDDAWIAKLQGKKFDGKPYIAFSTYGGTTKALESVNSLAESLGLKKVAEGLSCKGAPAGEMVEKSIALGRALAAAIKK